MIREEAFAALEALGAASAVVRYSGGGDEGGVDSVELFDADDAVLFDLHDHYPGDAGEPFEGAEELAEALEEPVDEQHGGFTGGGINGQITWVVPARKVVDRPAYEEYVEHGPYEV